MEEEEEEGYHSFSVKYHTILLTPRVRWNKCLTKLALLDFKFQKFTSQYACCNFYCNMHIATCNMHIAMQYRFFSSKRDSFRYYVFCINFPAICILLVAILAIKVLHCSGDDASPQHRSVLRAIHPLTPPKIITACSGGLPPLSNDDGTGRKASCGAQGGHFCRPWSVVVEMVVVGRWRLVTSYFLIPM